MGAEVTFYYISVVLGVVSSKHIVLRVPSFSRLLPIQLFWSAIFCVSVPSQTLNWNALGPNA